MSQLPTLLLVDAEEQALSAMHKVLEKDFVCLCASDAAQATR